MRTQGKNIIKVFYENNFVELLLTTFYFTFFGTVGAIIFGILAAQLVNQNIQGRTGSYLLSCGMIHTLLHNRLDNHVLH